MSGREARDRSSVLPTGRLRLSRSGLPRRASFSPAFHRRPAYHEDMSSPLPTPEQVTAALATVQDPDIGGRSPSSTWSNRSDRGGRQGGRRRLADRRGLPDPRENHQAGHRRVGRRGRGDPGPGRARIHDQGAAQGTPAQLRGGKAEQEIPFAQPDSLTKVYAIASGKGGVGKSSVTVNLAAALAARDSGRRRRRRHLRPPRAADARGQGARPRSTA